MVEALSRGPGRFASLYVHIPFCLSRCPYCAFHSRAGENPERMAGYLDLLGEEAAVRRIRFPEGARTIYIGGGTPTALPAPLLRRLLELVRHIAWGPRTGEFSCEALPASLDREKAGILAGAGVNRVTLGVQGFAAGVVSTLGRERSAERIGHALDILRQAGIGNLGIDLILGLPGESCASMEAGLSALLAGQPLVHVSLYDLSIEPGTPFAARQAAGHLALPADHAVRRMAHRLHRVLFRYGLRQYEVSNFARPGYGSLHNRLTWAGMPYAGLGEGAVSGLPRLRIHNPADAVAYREAVREGRIGSLGREWLDAATRLRERLMLGLRTVEGLEWPVPGMDGLRGARERLETVFAAMADAGCLRTFGNRRAVTRKGFFWLDGWLARLFAALDA